MDKLNYITFVIWFVATCTFAFNFVEFFTLMPLWTFIFTFLLLGIFLAIVREKS